jgi:hypothetical protein
VTEVPFRNLIETAGSPGTVTTMGDEESAGQDGHILEVPAEVVCAIGRVTIAAGELEVALAAIGADQAQGNMFVILAKPGEPLRAACRSIASIASPYKESYLPALERAAELLANRHSVVHALLINESAGQPLEGWTFLHYRTYDRHPADPGTLDRLATQLRETRARLVHILTAQINHRPLNVEIL